MEDKRRELVSKAAEIYMKFGVKSMTMDEMARQLGVSKKTLYLHVKDKNDLVEQCMMLSHENEQEHIAKIANETENAIEQMWKISQFIRSQLQRVHPSIFFDLAKYHPSVMNMMQCHKEEFVCGSIEENLVNGIKQGFYRENLNPKVISGIYVRLIEVVMDASLAQQSNLKADEVYSEMFRYHIRGCATKKGIDCLVELIKNNEDSLSVEF